jgi:hypothetical protein
MNIKLSTTARFSDGKGSFSNRSVVDNFQELLAATQRSDASSPTDFAEEANLLGIVS